MKYKNHSKNICLTLISSILFIAAISTADAQMPIRPMPGSPIAPPVFRPPPPVFVPPPPPPVFMPPPPPVYSPVNPPTYGGVISCSTFSHGLVFERTEQDEAFARNAVDFDCRGDNNTSNMDCDANIICVPGYFQPNAITCSTFSNGLLFQRSERNEPAARNVVDFDCRRDSRTSNAECDMNVTCRY